jgi:hypothetical protein
MAKWDIDKALASMEPSSAPGTTIQRALVDTKLVLSDNLQTRAQFGNGRIKLTPEEIQQGYVRLWSLAIGGVDQPKAFFHDRTIRGAYLQARKLVKQGKLAKAIPWGRQLFTLPAQKKAKPRDKRHPQAKKKQQSDGSPSRPDA